MTKPDNIIRIPQFQPYSGTKPDSAAGGTRHHSKRHLNTLPPESPRSVPSAPRGDSLGEVMI